MLILQVLYVVAALCVAGGIWAIAAGLRGRWEFSSPRCSRCGYDVRAQDRANEAARCSECGSSLAGDDGVRYAVRVRSRSLGRLGVGLVVIALATYLSATPISRYVRTRWMSGQRGWSSGSSGVEDSARWSQLAADLRAGRLSPESVDKALADLAGHYRGQGQSHGGTAHFAASFIDQAIASGKASPAALAEFCQAFHADSPQFAMHHAARVGEPFRLELSSSSGCITDNYELVWHLREAIADGNKPLQAILRDGSNSQHQGEAVSGTGYGSHHIQLSNELSQGPHQLHLAIDVGVLRRAAAKTGADGRPGAKGSWPEPIATWVVQRDVAVRIVAPGEPIVDMTDEAAYDPVKANGLKLKRVYARAGQDGTDVTVEWEPLQGKPQGLCHKISIRYGSTVRDVGRLMISRAGIWSIDDYRDRWHDRLPADITQVDVLLRPDQVQAERTPELGRIWSGSVEIKGVPITRYDLAYPATTQATGGKP